MEQIGLHDLSRFADHVCAFGHRRWLASSYQGEDGPSSAVLIRIFFACMRCWLGVEADACEAIRLNLVSYPKRK